MTYQESRSCALDLFTEPFIDRTFSASGTAVSAEVPIDVAQIQIGNKNVIYRVSSDETSFVFVMSKGTTKLNRETQTDFANLRDLRQQLIHRHLPVFVPLPYALTHNGNVSAFSFEYLPDHLELQSIGIAIARKADGSVERYYTTFGAATFDSLGSNIFNSFEQPIQTAQYMQIPPTEQDPNYRLKKELIARLTVMYLLTKSVPAEFAVNAGDFMFDPTKEDFDLRLITIRGGWRRIRNPGQFPVWLYKHLEGHQYPLFDYNKDLILNGVDKGEEIFNSQHR